MLAAEHGQVDNLASVLAAVVGLLPVEHDDVDALLAQHQVHAQGLNVVLGQLHAGDHHLVVVVAGPAIAVEKLEIGQAAHAHQLIHQIALVVIAADIAKVDVCKALQNLHHALFGALSDVGLIEKIAGNQN